MATTSNHDLPPKVESMELPPWGTSYKAYSEKDLNIAGTLSPLKMPETETAPAPAPASASATAPAQGTDAKNAFKDFLKGGKETVNEQYDKVKAWASENPNMAIGGGAVAGLAGFLAVFGFIIPALRARAHRAERNKHRNRHEKRAFDTEVSEEELLELFSEYLEHIEDVE